MGEIANIDCFTALCQLKKSIQSLSKAEFDLSFWSFQKPLN